MVIHLFHFDHSDADLTVNLSNGGIVFNLDLQCLKQEMLFPRDLCKHSLYWWYCISLYSKTLMKWNKPKAMIVFILLSVASLRAAPQIIINICWCLFYTGGFPLIILVQDQHEKYTVLCVLLAGDMKPAVWTTNPWIRGQRVLTIYHQQLMQIIHKKKDWLLVQRKTQYMQVSLCWRCNWGVWNHFPHLGLEVLLH